MVLVLISKPTCCRYIYPRHNAGDSMVVPYHPACLLCWGAHMNIQAVTNTAWSFYVLKVGGLLSERAGIAMISNVPCGGSRQHQTFSVCLHCCMLSHGLS